jgi:hypothetical protein
VILCAIARAPDARADDPTVVAEALFKAGKEAMEKKDFATACARFAESYRVKNTTGAMLNLALCHETWGKIASAWGEYRDAARIAHLKNDEERAQVASERATALEPKLSKLQIDAPKIPGLKIQRDGVELGPEIVGIPVAVDPGTHTIEATAEGRRPWSGKVNIGAERDFQKIAIPDLEKAPIVAKPPSVPPHVPDDAAASSSVSTRRTAGLALAGVGVIGIGVGAVTRVLGASKINGAHNDPTLCRDQVCSADGTDAIHRGNSLVTVSTVGFIAGGALTAAGVVLFATSKPAKKKDSAPVARIFPAAGPGGGSLSVVGSF